MIESFAHRTAFDDTTTEIFNSVLANTSTNRAFGVHGLIEAHFERLNRLPDVLLAVLHLLNNIDYSEPLRHA